MAVYDIAQTQLASVYDIDGNRLLIAYDIDGNIIYQEAAGKYSEQIGYLNDWLVNRATYRTIDATYVRERYRMDVARWVNGATAIACAQAMFAYVTMWQYTGDSEYLELSHGLLSGLQAGRTDDGGFEMYVYNTGAADHNKYTGGNSEVPINLFRTAEIDTEQADVYIQEGLLSTEFLLSKQNTDGSWYTSYPSEPVKSAMFTAQAIAAIAMGYEHTTNKSDYMAAIQNGFEFISSKILSDGRIETTYEEGMKQGVTTEFWRPPTSDQSIVIRGLAIVENYMKDYMDVSRIKAFRQSLMPYLNDCIGPEGAVRNGLGTSGLVNDIYGIADHIYVTSWAIEAYRFSAEADTDAEERSIAAGIVEFCSTNLYFSSNPNTNGTLRGAYNVRDHNWDTSALHQDSINEGGSEQIYVGWVMVPILMWMKTYAEESN